MIEISLWESDVWNCVLFLTDFIQDNKFDWSHIGISIKDNGKIRKKKFDNPKSHIKVTKFAFTTDENIFWLSGVVLGNS